MKRKGPPKKYKETPELKAEGEKARAQFRAAVDAVTPEDWNEIKEIIKQNLINYSNEKTN
jgi:hypothetical protein